MNTSNPAKPRWSLHPAVLFVSMGCALATYAKNPIREDFFTAYPGAVGSLLDDATTSVRHPHCGVCHYNFDGGGNRNPYGAALEAERAANGKNTIAALATIAWDDSDGDGYPNITEITNTNSYSNTPTFPGYSAANVGSISQIDVAEISTNLTPSTGVDNTPPTVTVFTPDGGETAVGNAATIISWNATDASGIAGIDLYVSLDNGSSYTPIAKNLPNTPSTFTWFVSNRPTSNALIKVEAIDNAANEAEDVSDAVFYIVSTNGFPGTTLRDFDLPGSQPIVDSGLPQELPSNCADCHGGYSEEHEPYRNWLGSMMAQAAVDPIFKANMSIAQQDAPDSGDLCLRCHNSRGWLDGRSTPTDGSQMTADDQMGVSCDLCHRLVDPIYKPGISPAVDEDIINNLEIPPQNQGNGMYVFDPNAHRRGPFADSVSPHIDLVSPFHQNAAICGTCHDVSNPVFERDGSNAEYVLNDMDAAPTNNSSSFLTPVERTYSEWFYSAYNSSNGVYAPQFAGNKDNGMVATCQDCHMPDIIGQGCDPAQFPTVPERPDLPLHDMTGGSVWLPNLLPDFAGLDSETAVALSNGTMRAEYMLRKAARMSAEKVGENLKVTVINDTGHKLPTGYPEGRRIWINVRFYDDGDALLDEFGGYDPVNAVLANDTQIYEIHPGIGTNLAPVVGLPPGPSLHFVLNNQIYEDNRIPPRGFTNSVFETFGGAPVGHHYDDGQYWDETYYAMPEGAVRADVQLYYQSISKEFVEFLYTNNVTDTNGTNLYNLWVANGKCPPALMTQAVWPENFTIQSIGLVDGNHMGISFNSISGYTYWVEYADALGSNTVWTPFSSGWFEVSGSPTIVTDDFTSATSGSAPTNGHRFYRIQR